MSEYEKSTLRVDHYVRHGQMYRTERCIDHKGQLHCLTGSAHRSYFPDGPLMIESWYIHGKKHRKDGPAVVMYNWDGSLVVHECRWYFYGERVFDEELELMAKDPFNITDKEFMYWKLKFFKN